jgi:PPP family 3-phenylpropionic acid transporter
MTDRDVSQDRQTDRDVSQDRQVNVTDRDVSQDRKKTSRRRTIRNAVAWRLYFLAAAIFVTVGLYLPYFPVWLAASGLDDREIALVTGAPFVARILITPVIAYIADKRGIAMTLAACASAMLLGYLALGVVNGFLPIFLGALLAVSMQGAMPSLNDALALAEIRRLDKITDRPLRYGRVRMCASLSALSMMLASGWIVSILPGRQIVFALICLAALAAGAAIWAGATIRKVRFDRNASGGLVEQPADLKLALIAIAAGSLIQASHAEVYSFGTLLWKAQGLPAGFVSIAWATGVAFESILFFSAEHVFGGRDKAVMFLIVGGLGAILRWSCMALNPSGTFILMLQAVHGLTFASTYLGTVLLLGRLAGRNHRARMQGWYSTASSLLMAISTVACGWLTTRFGAEAYFAMAALAACGLLFAIWCAYLNKPYPQSVGVGG